MAAKGHAYCLMQHYNAQYKRTREEAREFLDTIVAAGTHVTVYPYPGSAMMSPASVWGKPLRAEEAESLHNRLNDIKDHPGVFAWYMADEPELRPALPERCRAIYEVCRDTDPYHPCIMLNDTVAGIFKYVDGGDILMPDPYPCFLRGGLAAQPIEKTSKFIKACQEASQGRKAVWITPQAFNYGGLRPPEPARTHRRRTAEPALPGRRPRRQGLPLVHLRPERELPGSEPGHALALLRGRRPQGRHPGRSGPRSRGEGRRPPARAHPRLAPPGRRPPDRLRREHRHGTAGGDAGPRRRRRAGRPSTSSPRAAPCRSPKARSATASTPTRPMSTPPIPPLAARRALAVVRAEIARAEAARRRPGNLAFEDSGTTVEVSSKSRYGSTPDRVLDGIRDGMLWRADPAAKGDAWLVVRWPEAQRIGRLVVFSDTIAACEIEIPDGDGWKGLATATGGPDNRLEIAPAARRNQRPAHPRHRPARRPEERDDPGSGGLRAMRNPRRLVLALCLALPAAAQPAKDLLAHWRFDTATDGVVADASGNGHHATFFAKAAKAPAFADGIHGQAVILAGKDEQGFAVAESEDLNMTAQFTVMAWIRPSRRNATFAILCMKGDKSGNPPWPGWRLRFFWTRASFQAGTPEGGDRPSPRQSGACRRGSGAMWPPLGTARICAST